VNLLQVIIVVAFGAFCFGGGYLTAFIVTHNHWRDDMIKRGRARYNSQTGKWSSLPPFPLLPQYRRLLTRNRVVCSQRYRSQQRRMLKTSSRSSPAIK
jgi:hypothetical protein